MKWYALRFNLHIRQYIFAAYIFVEEKEKCRPDRTDEITIVRFLIEQAKRHWNESNIDELQQLSLDDFRLYVRLKAPFWYLFRTGDTGHVRQFMEYDVKNFQVLESCLSFYKDECPLKNFINIPSGQKQYMYLLEHHGFLQRSSIPTCRRILRVLCGIEAIRKTELDRDPPQKVLCLKIIFKYIREPYITSSEVKSIIKCLGRENVSDELLQKICTLYETYFPESAQPYQPRSLKHLSRCQMRENLELAGTYPEGVRMLYIPKQLHTYILIDYLPWIPAKISSYIEFDLPSITDHQKVMFRISEGC